MAEEKNYIRCRVILEVLGKPKEHIEKTLKSYVDKIRQNQNYMLLNEDIAEAKQQETMWSSFAELEMVFYDINSLLAFCIDYMPSSFEVIKPESINLRRTDLSDFLNDLQAKLHQIDMIAKELKAENAVLKKNLNTSFKNVITLILGARGLSDLEQLSKLSGINKEQLSPFLEMLLKDGTIRKEEKGYCLKC